MPPVAAPVVDEHSAALLKEAGMPRRALFLDRDGVINVDHGYVHTPEQTEWVPGIFDLARAARAAGHVLVVVTNQAGIARGLYDEVQFKAYARWMHARFEAEGAPLLATYYCPHHPAPGHGHAAVQCDCRKPRPGMLIAAMADWNIDPTGSVLIGDKQSDIDAANSAGIGQSRLIPAGHGHAREIMTLFGA